MNAHSVAPTAQTHNTRRFVAPLSEYDQGKALYKAHKPLSECVTDDMAAGWIDAADLAGSLAYLHQMEAEGAPYPAGMF